MNDIRPPKKNLRPTAPLSPQQVRDIAAGKQPVPGSGPSKSASAFGAGMPAGQPTPSVSPAVEKTDSAVKVPKKRSKLKVTLWSFAVFIGVLILGAVAAFGWYTMSLQPASPGNEGRIRVEIAPGTSPSSIAQLLEEKRLVRSRFAFEIYLRMSGTTNNLQAGTYSLSPSESTPAIVDHIVAGKVDQFSLTFLPGATLSQHRTRLLSAGYSEAEVDAALKKPYDHPLFASKPETADLEGYIYGETYKFDSSATVEEILEETFDHYYQAITKDNLVEGFKAQGLSLYDGLTLASIIQREVPSAADQKQVAQVFFKRLSIGMELGADATFQYAAKKLGVPPSVNLDSPYNTRKYVGLPPGPIATPGVTAMQAVASPAAGDFLYFVSGDDGKTYFSHTLEEHEENTAKYCQKNCLLQ